MNFLLGLWLGSFLMGVFVLWAIWKRKLLLPDATKP